MIPGGNPTPRGLGASTPPRPRANPKGSTMPNSSYPDQLRALAHFLDYHPELGKHAHAQDAGVAFHLNRVDNWQAMAAAIVADFGPATLHQTHSDWLVLTINDTPLGAEIALYVPRFAVRPVTDVDLVDLSGIIAELADTATADEVDA